MSGFFYSRCLDQVHPCCPLCGNSIPFHGWVIFHYTNRPHLIYLFIMDVYIYIVSSLAIEPVQFSCSVLSDYLQPPWTSACQASLFIIKSQSLLLLMSIESATASNLASILWHPFSSHLPSFPAFPSDFPSESVLCIRWSKYWSFSFNISLPNEYSGMSSFRMDCFDPLAVQGTLKGLLQHLLQHKIFTDQKY